MTSFYARDGARYVASASTVGPWDPKLEHGSPVAALLATRIEKEIAPRAGKRIARILSRHAGAAAYVISCEAAKTLLASDAKWSVPVDHLLFNPNVSDVAVRLQPYQ